MNTLQSIWNGLDWSYLLNIVLSVVPALLCITFHEVSHGWVAYRLGDPTAKDAGRLTLNPLKHIDMMGLLMMVVFKFGWAKPVPINPNRMRNPRTGVIWTSLAGPASNLLIAFVMMIPFRILESIPISSEAMYNTLSIIYSILYFFILVNIGLAVFNLIPIPPLDGSNILLGFLPYKAIYWVQQHRQVISFVFLILIFSDFLDTPLSYLQQLIFKSFTFLTNWVPLMVSGLTG